MAVHHILSGDAGSTGDRFGLVYTGDNVSGDRIESIGELENGGDVVVKTSAFVTVITSDSPRDNGYPSCSRIGSTSGEYFHLLIQLTH